MVTPELATLIGFILTIGTVIVGGVVLGNRQGRFEAGAEARLFAVEKAVEQKASKESHDNLCDRIDDIRAELDKRFDRLEQLLTRRRGGSDTDPGSP